MSSTLVSRNITVNGRRTSIRLEPSMWQALDEIRALEGITINQFCERVDAVRRDAPLTAAIRVAILAYYRKALIDRGILVSQTTDDSPTEAWD